jgi:hypothetical protein
LTTAITFFSSNFGREWPFGGNIILPNNKPSAKNPYRLSWRYLPTNRSRMLRFPKAPFDVLP